MHTSVLRSVLPATRSPLQDLSSVSLPPSAASTRRCGWQRLTAVTPPWPQALEVDAYSSVHDMIHASIISHGPQATLREVRQAASLLSPPSLLLLRRHPPEQLPSPDDLRDDFWTTASVLCSR